MVGSAFGVIFYGFAGNTGKVKYNKISFSRVNGGWFATINKEKIFFNYLPTEVEDIQINNNIIDKIKNTLEVDITYDENNSYAEEIALSQYQLRNILNSFNIHVRNGFTAANNFDIPIITCKDASSFVPIIYFEESNETSVTIDNGCIIADINNRIDAIRVKDRLLYGILGILG